MVGLDQEARRIRSELARDRLLEPRYPGVVRVVPVLAQHRPQRLALVHRDHRESTTGPSDRVQRPHNPFLSATDAYQRPLSLTVRSFVS